MTQTLQSPTTSEAAPASAARFIVNDQGEPLYALIDYELYLLLQETIDEWYAGQRAAAAYQAWLEDPSRGQDWDEFKAELIAEGRLDA
jgi:hypothetical protein